MNAFSMKHKRAMIGLTARTADTVRTVPVPIPSEHTVSAPAVTFFAPFPLTQTIVPVVTAAMDAQTMSQVGAIPAKCAMIVQ